MWRWKLVDSTISPDEWAVHADDFLKEIGGAYYGQLMSAVASTPDQDDLFFATIIEYVRRAQFILI